MKFHIHGKFPEQSPSLEHVKGLPVCIMYAVQEREGTNNMMTLKLQNERLTFMVIFLIIDTSML